MTLITPIDGQPALAEHVAQLTETLLGVRAEPVTLASSLSVAGGTTFWGNPARNGADLTDRTINFQTNGANRWRMGIIDTQAEGTPDVGGDFKLQYYWNSGGPRTLVTIDRDVGKWSFTPDTNIPVNVTGQMEVVSGFTNAVTIRNTTAANADRWEIGSYQIKGYGYGEAYPRLELDSASGLIRFTYGDLNPSARIAMTGTGSLQFYADNGQGIYPLNTAQNDLGTTGNRWRKVWAADAEFTNAPTVGGTAMLTQTTADARYLQLSGNQTRLNRLTINGEIAMGSGTMYWGDVSAYSDTTTVLTLDGSIVQATTNGRDLGSISKRWRSGFFGTTVSIAGSSATANQITTAITTDAQPRLQIDGNGYHKWGPGGSTAYDTTLQRTGVGALRVDNTLGIAVAPKVWSVADRAIQLGESGAVFGRDGQTLTGMTNNSYTDAGGTRLAILAGTGSYIALNGGSISILNAVYAGAGAAQTFLPRLNIVANGQTTLTPDAGVAALVIGTTAQPKITVASSAPSSPMTGDLWIW